MSKRMRASHIVVMLGVLALGAACVHLGKTEPDPRLGEMGKVKFVGGGGCSSSTVMAVGSTAVIEIEPATDEPLPLDLEAGSTAPAVIEAATGSGVDEVVLTAHEPGEAEVQLSSGGSLYDWLTFGAQPATAVLYTAPSMVFEGTTLVLKIDEVHGACGSDCPLIGGEFVQWSSEPTDAFTVLSDVDREVQLVVGAAGEATLLGAEPSEGGSLVTHAVTIVPVSEAGELDATLLVALPDDSVLDPIELPADVPAGALVLVQLTAAGPGGEAVPLTTHEAAWSMEGDAGVLSVYGSDDPLPVDGPIYSADAAGTVTLVAEVAVLGRTGRFDVTVTE